MKKINLLGRGYIGTEFYRQNACDVVVNSKFDYVPSTSNILYTISTTHNYHVYNNPNLDIDTNLTTLVTFLENVRKHYDDAEITFLSSWFVYGSKNPRFHLKEDARCDPTGFYSSTKLCAERLLVSYCNTFGIKYRILRLCNVIGGYDAGMGKKKNALQYMITELCKGHEIDLYDDDACRDYLDIRDVARAIKLAMNSASGETINIASGESYAIKDLIEYAQDKIGKGKINLVPAPEFHKIVQTSKIFLDRTKISKLGFTPEYSVYDTIDGIIENYEDN